MNNRSRRKIHSQTSNQKHRQKQPGLLQEESKQQQQQQQSLQELHGLQYPTQGQQNPAPIFDEPPQQLLPNHPMLSRQQNLGHHAYGREQQNYFYPYITAEQVRAWNDYQEFLWRLQREKKLQSLTSFLYSENSFLTPWSWNPEAPQTEEKRPMMFQPGSFFSYHIPPPQAKVEEQHSGQSQSSNQT